MEARVLVLLAVFVLSLGAPSPAQAYIGPGSGLTVIGAALAFLGGIVLVLIGFVWYPLKRIWRRFAGRSDAAAPADSTSR